MGVPWGTRWANIWLVLLIQPYSINENHKGRAIVRVIVKWLVLVKIYGNSPIKLLNKIIENNEINRIEFPFELFLINNLNSLWSVNRILNHIIENREGNIQNSIGIINSPINVLNQLKEMLSIVVEGSKTENKLFIIFNLYF